MSERTDTAWDEYLSTGIDPTGGELEDADKEEVTDEIVPGEWQQYAKRRAYSDVDDSVKLRNHERIRTNRERIKWERKHPEEAKALKLIKEIAATAIFTAILVWIVVSCFL